MSALATLRAALGRDISWQDFRQLAARVARRASSVLVQEAPRAVPMDAPEVSPGEDDASCLLLEVPEDQVLSFETRIPPLSGSSVKALIENNFGIWSPFRIDEVYFCAAVISAEGGQRLEIHYTPRTLVAPVLARAESAGRVIDGLVFGDDIARVHYFDRRRLAWKWLRRNATPLLGAGLVMSLALFLGAMLYRTEQAEAILRAEIASKLHVLRRLDTPGNRALAGLQAIMAPGEPGFSTTVTGLIQKALPPDAVIISLEVKGGVSTITVPEAQAEAILTAFQATGSVKASSGPETAPGTRIIRIVPGAGP